MHTHANARLMQKGRLRLVSQHLNDHRPLAVTWTPETGPRQEILIKWRIEVERLDLLFT